MIDDLIAVVAANIRRLRGEQGRTLSELARASGIAKATLSALEAGKGNPTIETLSSLATALGVPFGDLLAGGGPEPVHVVHADEGATVAGTANDLRLIVRLPGNPPIELYEARFPPRSRRSAGAHGPGTREHVLVVQGAPAHGARRAHRPTCARATTRASPPTSCTSTRPARAEPGRCSSCSGPRSHDQRVVSSDRGMHPRQPATRRPLPFGDHACPPRTPGRSASASTAAGSAIRPACATCSRRRSTSRA